jgi:hypothetical protein
MYLVDVKVSFSKGFKDGFFLLSTGCPEGRKRSTKTARLETSTYGKKIEETAGRRGRRPAGEIRDLRRGL